MEVKFDSKCKSYRNLKTGKFCKNNAESPVKNYGNYGDLTYFPDDLKYVKNGQVDKNYEQFKNDVGIGVIVKNNIKRDQCIEQINERLVNTTLIKQTIIIKNFIMELATDSCKNKKTITCPFKELKIKVYKKDGKCKMYLADPSNKSFYQFVKDMVFK